MVQTQHLLREGGREEGGSEGGREGERGREGGSVPSTDSGISILRKMLESCAPDLGYI